MRRRDFLKTTVAAGSMFAAPALVRAENLGDDRPNILFIMTDQQSGSMMSCAGEPDVKTPGMDSICAAGTRFERCYATNPVCVPSRFSLQTGRMPSAIGMRENQSGLPVPDEMASQSLGPILSRAGYRCGYGGKSHVPGQLYNAMFRDGYEFLGGDSRDGLVDSSMKFLGEKHNRPFFLFTSFINPHDICYMAINDHSRQKGGKPHGNRDSRTCEEVIKNGLSADDLEAWVDDHCPPLPANFEVPKGEPEGITLDYLNARKFRLYARENWPEAMWRLHRYAYRRLTEMVDRQIAQVLEALHDSGRADNTLIVFTSDHGDMDSAHRLEHKSILYEEAARVPFVMSLPGRIQRGRVDDDFLISNGLDLLPTLCDYAGAKCPEDLLGHSVRQVAELDPTGPVSITWRDMLVVESQNGRMIRDNRYKYCVYERGANRETLIDLKTDPGEMTNLIDAPELKEKRDELRKRLAQWCRRADDRIAKPFLVRSEA